MDMPAACPRREVRSGYAARTADAKRLRPFGRAKNQRLLGRDPYAMEHAGEAILSHGRAVYRIRH